MEIREAVLGKGHPDVAKQLNNLALLCQNQVNYNFFILFLKMFFYVIFIIIVYGYWLVNYFQYYLINGLINYMHKILIF